MKIVKRAAETRGSTDIDWLKSRHTFSFGQYQDAEQMGYRSLRVFNDDRVAPAQGFGTHPHRDMEIFSYVVSGSLEHKDSLGNGRVINAGEFQYMSAGRGIRHSEFNPSETEPTHFLQVWIEPATQGGEPLYADRSVKRHHLTNTLNLLASSDGRGDSFAIRQKAEISFGQVEAGHSISVPASESLGYGWIHVVSGSLTVLGENLNAGDAAALEGESAFEIEGIETADFLFFRLA